MVRAYEGAWLTAALVLRRLPKEHRERANLSQREVADRIERGQTFVSAVERGQHRVSVLEFLESDVAARVHDERPAHCCLCRCSTMPTPLASMTANGPVLLRQPVSDASELL
jgi:Helix-turn-helix domain